MSLKVLRCQQANVNTVRTNYGVHVHWYAEHVNISAIHPANNTLQGNAPAPDDPKAFLLDKKDKE